MSSRAIQPKYEFDPEGHYADPQVQTWAKYYAEGGQDTAGAEYFISVPGLKLNGQQTSASPDGRPALTIDTNLQPSQSKLPIPPSRDDFEYLRNTYGVTVADAHSSSGIVVKCDFEPSRADEVAVNAGDIVCVIHRFQDEWSLVRNQNGDRGVIPTDCLLLEGSSSILKLPGPRTPSSLSRLTPLRSPLSDDGTKRKSKKNVLGLLEFLHLTKRSKTKELEDRSTTLASTVETTKQSLQSALKTQSSSRGKESDRRVRFHSPSVSENLGTQSSTSKTGSDATLPILWNVTSDEDVSDCSPISPQALPPRYEEVDSLAVTRASSEKHFASTPPYTTSPFRTNRVSLDSKPLPLGDDKVDLNAVEATTVAPSGTNVVVMNSVTVVTNSTLLAESIASQSIIYRNMLSFLFRQVSPDNSLWGTLYEYYTSLQSLDSVSSLVQSHDYRANLLQVASALDISEEVNIREALQRDENEIAGVLHVISETSRRAVLALEGDDAQKFLDVVQDVLDKGYLLNGEETARARRLLVRLSETCDKLPSSLFIKGVERPDEQATFGGGFGDVYRATYNGQHVALKRMRIFQRDPGVPNVRRRFCREALVWQHLNSSFIVPFLGIEFLRFVSSSVFLTFLAGLGIDAESFPSFLCMVSPWMSHGTVLKHLADHGRAGVNKRLHEVTQGLAYLHSQKIVHGDLRGSNILINGNWQACLTDFGLTVFNDATAATFTSRREGSVRWMAPELHVPEHFGLDRFRLTFETDIYAFGCVCLELYTGRPPFCTQQHTQLPDSAVMLKVIQGVRPERPTGEGEMSDQMWKMVEMCWSQHFADRLKTDEVVEFTRGFSDPNTKSLDLPVFSEVPKSLLPSDDDWDDLDLDPQQDKSLPIQSPLYLQEGSSLSTLSIERLPPFPHFPIRPFPAYPPVPGQSLTVYSDGEDETTENSPGDDLEYADHDSGDSSEEDVEDGETEGVSKDDLKHAGFLDEDKEAEVKLDGGLKGAGKKLDNLDDNSEVTLSAELADYWDLVEVLDVALNTNFSLTLSEESEMSKPAVNIAEPYLPSVSPVITTLLTICFAFYFVLYLFVLVYLMLAGLLLQPVVIGRI
ncbi:hypothetical protein D9758_010424 [Tetrapyrgos nigripes]|uniref:mitogen-activated protein kinase kinase kinase n=1 Tax=Tetrapyrgos nigripes TaxID=182062 RepID=A0A8H5CNK0_9AGAR|nr:hypothetical protein D9758_010424 [Tetrapyrgos nigripes]